MNPRSALLLYQHQRLTEIQQLGLFTDLSLAAKLRELDDPRTRSALSHYRAGERSAPFGLLDAMLLHCGSLEERAAVLSVWAEDWGLAVVPRLQPETRVRLRLIAGELEHLAGPVAVRRAA